MVEWGRDRNSGRGRTETWPAGDAAGGRRAVVWPIALSGIGRPLAERLRAWALADTGPGRLLPWLPVFFGLGIAIYFAAGREPAWWAALGLAVACATVAVLARRRPMGFPVALALTAAAAGFATATLKSVRISHPVLSAPAWSVAVSGFVERREERERTDRIVVRTLTVDGARLAEKPERVRVSLRKGTAPAVGAFVTFKARLGPPSAPLRPGGYDFARDLYFQRIGATGFVLGSIAVAEAPQAAGLSLRYTTAVESLRDAIDRRIRASVGGDRGAIAAALITGKRDAISAPVNDAMYVSSLAHVLSISGYHMAVVAGVVFFAIRALLALVPGFASRFPIKKWAAAGALAAAAFYLALSGAEVATQRAFVMTAVVLVGVMADRPALTLRTLAVAAFAVLLIAPEAVVHPSFQMSFAATLALIAAYERSLRWSAGADSSMAARVALWGGREVAVLVLASLVAGLATMPYAAYHFHRIAPYGVLANLVAMPIVSALVMPSGILGLVLLPFGFDGLLWWLMGEGIGFMIAVAVWVAGLPGALVRMPAFGTGPLLLGTAGLVLLCLLRTPLRWSGAALALAATVLAVRAPQPDALVSADGQSFAVRGADGRLSIHRSSRDSFTVRSWLAADGDARLPTDPTLRDGILCDAAGCIGRLADGRLVARVLTPEAFEEDCRRAALVVTTRDAPPACAAQVIDRRISRGQGAIALTIQTGGVKAIAARPPDQDRPWARAPAAPAVMSGTPVPAAATRRPQDATPRSEDMEPGD